MKAKKAKRPALQKRHGFIQIRVTDTERATIDRLAYENKLSLSEFIRRAALSTEGMELKGPFSFSARF